MREAIDLLRSKGERTSDIEYAETQILVRSLLRNIDETKTPISELITLAESLESNPAHTEEYGAVHSYLKNKTEQFAKETRDIDTIKLDEFFLLLIYLANTDPASVKTHLDGSLEKIRTTFQALKQQENWQLRNRLAKYIETIATKVADMSYLFSIQDAIKYTPPLDLEAHTRNFEYKRVRVNHLTAPELAGNPIEILNQIERYLASVRETSSELKGWNGDKVAEARRFLRKNIEEIIAKASEELRTIDDKEVGWPLLFAILDHLSHINEFLYTNISIDLTGINPEVLFTLSNEIFQGKISFGDTAIDHSLLVAALEGGVIDMVRGIKHLPEEYLEKAREALNFEPPESAYDKNWRHNSFFDYHREEKFFEQFEEIFNLLESKISNYPELQETYEDLKTKYKDLIYFSIERAGQSTSIVEKRLNDFWKEADINDLLGLLKVINKTNNIRRGYVDRGVGGYPRREAEYNVEFLLNKALSEIYILKDEDKAVRLQEFIDMFRASTSHTPHTISRLLYKHGFIEEASRFAAQKGSITVLIDLISENREDINQNIISEKGWSFERLRDQIIEHVRSNPTLIPVFFSFLVSALKDSRMSSRSEEVLTTINRIKDLLTTTHRYNRYEEFQNALSENDRQKLVDSERELRDLVWTLWQQGSFTGDSRIDALKILIQDGQDLSIASLNLSQQEQVLILYAEAELAKEARDFNTLRKIIEKIKKSPFFGSDNLIKGRVEKYLTYLNENDFTSVTLRDLKERITKDKYGRAATVIKVIEAGRIHDALLLSHDIHEANELWHISLSLISLGEYKAAHEVIFLYNPPHKENKIRLNLIRMYGELRGFIDEEELGYLKNSATTSIDELIQSYIQSAKQKETSEETFEHLLEALADDPYLSSLLRHIVALEGMARLFQENFIWKKEEIQQTLYETFLAHELHREAERLALTQDNKELLLTHLEHILSGNIDANLEYIFLHIKDIDRALEVTEILKENNRKEDAKSCARMFLKSLDRESKCLRDNPESMAKIRSLTITASSFEVIKHIKSLYREDPFTQQRFIQPLWESALEMEFTLQELSQAVSMLSDEQILNIAQEAHKIQNKKKLGDLLEALEFNITREKALRKYTGIYALYASLNSTSETVIQLREFAPEQRVKELSKKLQKDSGTENIIIAASILSSQEVYRLLQILPKEQRFRVSLLIDWYKSTQTSDSKEVGSIIERTLNRIEISLRANDSDSLTYSLSTLLALDHPEASGRLLNVCIGYMEQGGSETNLARICTTLSKMDSFKANTILTQTISNLKTPDILARYLIRLLVENGHLDKNLRNYFESKRMSKEELDRAVNQFRTLIRELGINPDAAVMQYIENRSYDAWLEGIRDIDKQKNEFILFGDYIGQGRWLLKNVEKRILYFLKYGGRTGFSLINNYNFAKFTHLLKRGVELEIAEEPLESFKIALEGVHSETNARLIMDHIREGRAPLLYLEGSEAAWEVKVDVSQEDIVKEAKKTIGETVGSEQLGLFAKALMFRSVLDRSKGEDYVSQAETLWSEAGDNLTNLSTFVSFCEKHIDSKDLEVPKIFTRFASEYLPLYASLSTKEIEFATEHFETTLITLGKQVATDIRQSYKQGKISATERDRLIEMTESPHKVLSTLLSRELPQNFSEALEEYSSHVENALRLSREVKNLKKEARKAKDYRLRFLDKSESLPEYLRFADSAQCCFTSQHFSDGPGSQEYVARIWKDPLSFVLHIEDLEQGSKDKRKAVGFIFGSYGINRKNEPVLLLNGVYMDKKTDLVASKIVQTIEDAIAKPLGVSEILIASLYGGRGSYPGFESTEDEYLRLRALRGRYGNDPETNTYDDIGLVAIDKDESIIQNTNVINQWAKTKPHITRKRVVYLE